MRTEWLRLPFLLRPTLVFFGTAGMCLAVALSCVEPTTEESSTFDPILCRAGAPTHHLDREFEIALPTSMTRQTHLGALGDCDELLHHEAVIVYVESLFSMDSEGDDEGGLR